MQKVTLGKTGFEVSRLGVGLAEIGSELSFDASPAPTGLTGWRSARPRAGSAS